MNKPVCGIVPIGTIQRCGQPAVAVYVCRTTVGDVQIFRCALHDAETHARFTAGVGGLKERRVLEPNQ